MLMPKRTKYRKTMRGNFKGKANKGNYVAFGDFGLAAMEPHWITNRQIESVRVSLNRSFKRAGDVYIRIFPDKPYTQKPAETRMGKGKGNVEGWVAVVKPGRIMFEVGGVDAELAKKALKKAAYKLPIKTKIVSRDQGGGC